MTTVEVCLYIYTVILVSVLFLQVRVTPADPPLRQLTDDLAD